MVTTTARTILIIDDNWDDVLIMKRVLTRISPEIRTEIATSGEAGLALLRDSKPPPSLILLDLNMPGMSGVDALCQIRGDDRLKDIPVVVVTHSALESDEKEAYAAGADSFLHKAFDMDQFHRDIESAVRQWLGN